MQLDEAIHASNRAKALLTPDEQTILYELARQVPARGTIVELGSWMGGSTIMLAAGSLSGPQAKVYTVDLFAIVHENKLEYETRVDGDGSNYFSFFLANLRRAGVESVVVPIQSPTVAAAKAWQGPQIDLLFIDANHYYKDVRDDYIEWSAHCAPGAWCVFHDYGNESAPGVRGFVDQAIDRGLLHDIHFADTIAYGKVVITDRDQIERRLKPRVSDLLTPEPNRSGWFLFAVNHCWMALRAGARTHALRYALQAIRWKPWKSDGWRLLAYVLLRRSAGGNHPPTELSCPPNEASF